MVYLYTLNIPRVFVSRMTRSTFKTPAEDFKGLEAFFGSVAKVKIDYFPQEEGKNKNLQSFDLQATISHVLCFWHKTIFEKTKSRSRKDPEESQKQKNKSKWMVI